ncbi:MAG: holo-ACP synthase [Chloroflexota bacterium]
MNLKTGVDIIELDRINQAAERHGGRFLDRVFTNNELTLCKGNTASLAARFAAKEAVSKALGCGIGSIGWKEIEILRGENGEPVLFLHGNAKTLSNELGLSNWAISLSHTREIAIAQVTAASQF